MKKRIISLLLALVLAAGLLPALSAPAEAGGTDNFERSRTYEPGMFRDVSAGAWYSQGVREVYEYGLMNGSGGGRFNPQGNMTYAEALALVCRIHHIYHGGDGFFEQGEPWYQVYLDYAAQNGIDPQRDFTYFASSNVGREDFAALLCSALPSSAFPAINEIPDEAIPDVSLRQERGDPAGIYRLYRAGILTGSDAHGTLQSKEPIQRCAVAEIAARVVNPELRKTFTLTPYEITPEDIQGIWAWPCDDHWSREIIIEGSHYQEAYVAGSGAHKEHVATVTLLDGTFHIEGNDMIIEGTWHSNGYLFGEQQENGSFVQRAVPFLGDMEAHWARPKRPIGVVKTAAFFLEDGTLPMLDVAIRPEDRPHGTYTTPATAHKPNRVGSNGH